MDDNEDEEDLTEEQIADEEWDRSTAAILERHCTQIMEHFDSVQIICTKDERNVTRTASFGGGNMFARLGSVRSWLDYTS